MIQENLRVRDIVTREALENCITVLMASGGSTNLLIHLTRDRPPGRNHTATESLPQNQRPHTASSQYQAGGRLYRRHRISSGRGVPALMKELESRLHTDALTVTGKTVGENLAKVEHSCNPKAIAPIDHPLSPNGGIATLFGNLAPRGAVIKRAAASPELLKFRGEARVFDTLADAEKYLLDENSDMDEHKAVILRGYGPKGAPGMPEFGNYMPIPAQTLPSGVKDYLRITDARMSGGAFGTVVLHVCPEAAAGGPLGALRDGDIITMDVDAGTLNVELSDEEIARRLAETKFEPKEKFERGLHQALYRSGPPGRRRMRFQLSAISWNIFQKGFFCDEKGSRSLSDRSGGLSPRRQSRSRRIPSLL